MSQIAKMMVSGGTFSGRYIECLQVGNEQVIIEIRPAVSNLPAPAIQGSTKWMEPAHWNELYAMLIDVASAHIKSSEKNTDPLKGQSPLIKVIYQFKPFVKSYQDLLSPYEYQSGNPLRALDTKDDFRGVKPYRSILVALVFPSENNIKGFDKIPNFWTPRLPGEASRADHAGVSGSKTKRKRVSVSLSSTEIKTDNPESTEMNNDDESNSTLHERPNTLTVKAFLDKEAPGSYPLGRKEELTESLASGVNNHGDCSDLFARCDGAETSDVHSHLQVKDEGCSSTKKTEISDKSQDEKAGSSLLCNSQLSAVYAHDRDFVPKTKQARVRKCLKKLPPKESQNKLTSKGCLKKLPVKENKLPSKGSLMKIPAKESKDKLPSEGCLMKLRTKESENKLPSKGCQKKLPGKVGRKRMVAKEDVRGDILPKDTDKTDSEENVYHNPMTDKHLQSELDMKPDRELEYPSSDEIMAKVKPSKKKQAFYKFVCERKTGKRFITKKSIQPRTNFKADSDNNEEKNSGSQPIFSSSLDNKQNNLASETSQQSGESISGAIKMYQMNTILPKKTSDPPKAAGLPLVIEDAQNSKDESHRDETNNLKTKQPRKHMTQASRKLPRKASAACSTVQDSQLDSQQSTSQRNKSKDSTEPEEEMVELTDNQKKLFQMYRCAEKTTVKGHNAKGPKRKKGIKEKSPGHITDNSTMTTKKVETPMVINSESDENAEALVYARLQALSKEMFGNGNDSDDEIVPQPVITKISVSESKKRNEEKARYINIMKNLNPRKIANSFKKHIAVFHGIFTEKIPCVRHNLFKAGVQEQIKLRYSTATNPYSDEQLSQMMNLITEAFCKDDPFKCVKYLWMVILPEVANYVFMDEFNLDYQGSLLKIHEIYIVPDDDSD